MYKTKQLAYLLLACSLLFPGNNLLAKANSVVRSGQTQTTVQEEREIKGTVKDEKGEPIAGAGVFEVGTTNGVTTDIDGNFTLKVAGENSVLSVSFIGFATQEVKVGTHSTFNIVLKVDQLKLDDVVVVGYGVQKKVNMTGSISTVKAKDLTPIATANLSNTLAGRAPGINITGNSGLMGATSSIRIRGGFGDPLFVIDGIIRDKRAFDALDANEIDQMSFLKDAATASVYGSRAGNGVVLITTKKGSKVVKKPEFDYQGSYTFMTPTLKLMSDRTDATDELIYQNRVADFLGKSLPNGEEEFNYFKNRNYNVNDYIWQTPWNTKHSISVNGAGERISYYALVNYLKEEGSYKNMHNDKINFRSNVTAEITDYIKMNLNLSGFLAKQRRFYWPFSGDDEQTVGDLYRCTFNWPKTYPFYLHEDGTPANNKEITDYPVQTTMGSWQAWNVIDQVVSDDRYIKTSQREFNALLSFDIDLSKITKGLSSKVVGSYVAYDYSRKKYLTFQKNYVWIPADPDKNRFIPAAPDPNKINIFTFSHNQEDLEYGSRIHWDEQFNWFLNYMRDFGKHSVNGSLIFEQASNGGTNCYTKAESPLTHFDQDFVFSADRERRDGHAKELNGGRLSWIGRFNYSYAEKYIAEFSFRYDGNTLFPKEKRWGFFPSFSLAWRLSNENFMESTKSWLNDLKLRASVGTTGNDLNVSNKRITPFSYIPTYVSVNDKKYMFGSNLATGIKSGDIPNPDLTWATSTTYNGGFDFELLNHKLVGQFDAFYRLEKDILGSRILSIPDTYGQKLAPENYAERSWRGFEINATWRDSFADGQVYYSISGNMGYSKDKWEKLDVEYIYQDGSPLAGLSKVGRPNDIIIGHKTLGMVRTQEQLDEMKAKGMKLWGRDPYLGCLYYEDIRGEGYSDGPDGKIDENDVQLLSTKGAPRINYGIATSISWKGLSLDMSFQGVGAYDRMISNLGGKDDAKGSPGIRQYGGSIRPYYPIWADNVWTKENPNAKYPRPVGSNWQESGTGSQSFWIRSGRYLRLKNLNLGYTLPKHIVEKVGLSYAQVFFNGTNLFVISPMTEFQDPEQNCYDSYPLMKTFTFGLNIKF